MILHGQRTPDDLPLLGRNAGESASGQQECQRRPHHAQSERFAALIAHRP